jgi:hypothetical protein
MKSIEHRYLQFCTRNDAFSFFARNAIKLILSRQVMMVKQFGEKKEVLHNAIMVLEASASMRRTHKRWSWSLRNYVELDALEMLWKCLATRPGTESSNSEVMHALVLGNVAWNRGVEDELELCYVEKWSRIKQFRDTALALRTSQQESMT